MAKTVIQFSIFLENKVGRLAQVCSLMGQNNINILGFSIADAGDFGVFRLIVDKPEQALQILRNAGLTARQTEVICVNVPHRPGGLGSVLQLFTQAGINIEYMYAVANTLIVFGVQEIEKAASILEANNIPTFTIGEIIK